MKYITDREILGVVILKLCNDADPKTEGYQRIKNGYVNSIFDIHHFCQYNGLSLDEVMMVYDAIYQKLSIVPGLTLIEHNDVFKSDVCFNNRCNHEEILELFDVYMK